MRIDVVNEASESLQIAPIIDGRQLAEGGEVGVLYDCWFTETVLQEGDDDRIVLLGEAVSRDGF